jgi:hypothetical protein
LILETRPFQNTDIKPTNKPHQHQPLKVVSFTWN